MSTICVISICRIRYKSNDKYKCTQVDTIQDLMKNVTLLQILNIMNEDICGTQYEIVTKYISMISTVSI